MFSDSAQSAAGSSGEPIVPHHRFLATYYSHRHTEYVLPALRRFYADPVTAQWPGRRAMLVAFTAEVLQRFSEVELGDFFFRAMYSHSVPPIYMLASLRLAAASGDTVAGRKPAPAQQAADGPDVSKASGGGGLLDHVQRLHSMLQKAPGTPEEEAAVANAAATPVHKLLMPHVDSDRAQFAKEGREGGGGLDVFPVLAQLRMASGPFGASAAPPAGAVRATSAYCLQAGLCAVDAHLGAFYASGDAGTFVGSLLEAALPWGDDLGERDVTECLPLLQSHGVPLPRDVTSALEGEDVVAAEKAIRFALGRYAAQALLSVASQHESAARVLLGRLEALAPAMGGDAWLGTGGGSLEVDERRAMELLPALAMLLARGRVSGKRPTEEVTAGLGGARDREIGAAAAEAAASAR